jgi:hypothetical protein
MPFAHAWKTAMRLTHPNAAIYLTLMDTRAEWEAAYERRPATSREEAMARLAAWLDVTS